MRGGGRGGRSAVRGGGGGDVNDTARLQGLLPEAARLLRGDEVRGRWLAEVMGGSFARSTWGSGEVRALEGAEGLLSGGGEGGFVGEG